MTPACRLLDKKDISYSIHEYSHDNTADHKNYGNEAVQKLGLSSNEVFKTLLVCDGKSYYVAVLPVAYQLNLKKMAAAVGAKKVTMADSKDAMRITGYLVGGISPLAQKKQLPTIIAQQAIGLTKMYISGGRRGLDIGISPQDLSDALQACFCDIVDS